MMLSSMVTSSRDQKQKWEMAEAIDIYKKLCDYVFYGPEEQSAEHDQQEQ